MADKANDPKKKRSRLSQADVPAYDITESMRVPVALRDQYGKQATRPLAVAAAMDMSPNSSTFRMLTGAAVAYGLVDGGAQADVIGLTDLGKRVIAPTVEGDDLAAKREAIQRPRVIRKFLKRYDGSRLPTDAIGRNVLEALGVPGDSADRALQMIMSNAASVGLLREVKGFKYVELTGVDSPATAQRSPAPPDPEAEPDGELDEANLSPKLPSTSQPATVTDLNINKRVFITHGRNRDIVSQLKEVLTFGGFTPVVSVEQEATAVSVTDKVMTDMRSCGAAIVHVGTDQTLLDATGAEHKILNPNVLIEVGAALALYGRKFILLVEQGSTLPSNLHGMYEVRYSGDKLDYESTMKLLRAFNEFRTAG